VKVANSPRILIYAPHAHGGIAEHTFQQAVALERAGAMVLCLCSAAFLPGRALGFPVSRVLTEAPPTALPKLMRRVRQLWFFLGNQSRLAWEIVRQRPDLVLLDAYAEYLAPLWIWPHWFLARVCGVRYAANLHDPMRTFCVGPAWWHAFSGRLVYLALDFVLVHGPLPERSSVPGAVRVVVVPMGVYEVPPHSSGREETRRLWGVCSGQKVLLAFGEVRDNKNLDLVIRALVANPSAFFVIAGRRVANKERPFAFYRDLALRLGVADRCCFHEGFVGDEQVGDFFEAADFVALTYSSEFHSQSAVLGIAVPCRRPVLASAGPSPLLDAVQEYRLGVAVEPDSAMAVAEGLRRLLSEPQLPMWESYESHVSWGVNARGILRAAGLPSRCRDEDGTTILL